MRFYFYDASENVNNDPSNFYLHGLIKRNLKSSTTDSVQKKETSKYISCSVKVKRCFRYIYIECKSPQISKETFETIERHIYTTYRDLKKDTITSIINEEKEKQQSKKNTVQSDIEIKQVRKRNLENKNDPLLCNKTIDMIQVKYLINAQTSYFNLNISVEDMNRFNIKKIFYGSHSSIENFLLEKSIGSCCWLNLTEYDEDCNKIVVAKAIDSEKTDDPDSFDNAFDFSSTKKVGQIGTFTFTPNKNSKNPVNLQKIKQPPIKNTKNFHCEFEITVNSIDEITVLSESETIEEPLFKIASINMTFDSVNSTTAKTSSKTTTEITEEKINSEKEEQFMLKSFSCIIESNVNIESNEIFTKSKEQLKNYQVYHFSVIKPEDAFYNETFDSKNNKESSQLKDLKSRNLFYQSQQSSSSSPPNIIQFFKQEQRKKMFETIQNLIINEDPDIIINHGFFGENMLKFLFESSRNKFLTLHNPFKRRKHNISKLKEEDLFRYSEASLQMNGRLIFDTRLLLETVVKDQISKQIRTDKLQEIADAYKCNDFETYSQFEMDDKHLCNQSSFHELETKLNRENLYDQSALPAFFENIKSNLHREQQSETVEKKNRFSTLFKKIVKNNNVDDDDDDKKPAKTNQRFIDVENQSERENMFTDKNSLSHYIRNHIYNCHVQIILCHKLSVISFTRELTKECGNLWSNNLITATSNPIEFIIMHNLIKKNFIITEKKNRKTFTNHESFYMKNLDSDDEENDEENSDDSDDDNNKKETDTVISNEKKRKATGSGNKTGRYVDSYKGATILDIEKKEFSKGLIFLIDITAMYGTMILKHKVCITNPKEFDLKNRAIGENVSVSSTSSSSQKNINYDENDDDIVECIPSFIKNLMNKRKKIQENIQHKIEEQKLSESKKEKQEIQKQLKNFENREKVYKLIVNKCYGMTL